jgi:ribosomal protein S18 acetylase RimI-like enzyme
MNWRELTEADLLSLVGLASQVKADDGGHPMATTEAFLRSRFLAEGARSRAAFDGDVVLAAVATRPIGSTRSAFALTRTGDLGPQLVDWALDDPGVTRFETESLTPAADELFTSRGLRRTFAEDVMARDLTAGAPDAVAAAELSEWSDELAPRFFAVYDQAFRDRPGFPGWESGQWIEWTADDEDFAPQWTLLATVDGADVGFITAARGAWVVQLGVSPAFRGTGLGAGLTGEALRRMRAGGETVCFLDVNVDNPGAARLYRSLDFTVIGRRARYERG